MKSLILALLMPMLGFSNICYAAQTKISFEGTINRVEAGTYNVGQMVSGFVTYDYETPLTWSSAGSPPYTTNFNGAVDDFVLHNQRVDHVTFNILSQTAYYNPNDHAMGFKVSGYDDITGLYENIDLDLRGYSLLENIYTILEEPNSSDISNATFGYTRQKLGLLDGFLQERFYGNVDSLKVTNIPIPSSLILFITGFTCIFLKHFRKSKI